MYTKEQMKNDLVKLGIKKGDVILMHSSYKSLGGIEGGAMAVFEALTETIGEDGTLIIPALSYDNIDYNQPVFDKATTQTCIGYLPEFFRTSFPDVKRSLHATHSCCVWGKLTDEIIEDHELDNTPVGKNSPFSKLPYYDGKILMLGCFGNITMMHGVEETIIPIPKFNCDYGSRITYILKDGNKVIERKSYRHNFLDECGNHIDQCYSRVYDILEGDEISHGYVLDAECYLIDAKATWRKAQIKMLEDINYFVQYHN